MTFWGLSIRNILRHRARNLLTALGIALSVLALYSILSFNGGFMRNLDEELRKTGVQFMVMPAGCPHEVASLVLHGAVIPTYLDPGMPRRVAATLGDAAEVVAPMLVFQKANKALGRVDLIHGARFELIGLTKPSWKFEGRLPERSGEILLGSDVAEHDKTGVGATYTYAETMRFTVTGVLRKTNSKDDGSVHMPLADAQRLLGREDAVTAVGVRLRDSGGVNAQVAKLSAAIPGIQVVTMGQVMNSISTLAASARVLSLSIVAIAVLVSVAGVMNTTLMAVFERTQEIGMMRSVGASRRDIFRVVMLESFLLSILGGAGGVAAALLVSRPVEGFVKGFMPYVPPGSLIVYSPGLAAACLGCSVALGLVAGVYPALRASAISPIEAIRG
jgi:putative ABC transport system permease protein